MIEPGWQAAVTGRGDLLLSRVTPRPAQAGIGAGADPVMLEIFNNLFMSVAEQMGVRLQSTAHSVNIKERLDFSCAVFDADGGLIANAPHMPVHLGSMSESIKMVIGRNPDIRRGDVYVLNDPYHGGTHIPDITVVTPVFAPRPDRPATMVHRRARDNNDGPSSSPTTDQIWFYVASRGHHAEIGGMSPGSMPAASTRVEQEGVLIDRSGPAGARPGCQAPPRGQVPRPDRRRPSRAAPWSAARPPWPAGSRAPSRRAGCGSTPAAAG